MWPIINPVHIHTAPTVESVPTGGTWSFPLLMAFTCVLLLSPQSFISALRPLHIAFITAGLAALAYALDRFRCHQALVPLTRPTVLMLALLGLAIFTVPLSIWPGGSFTFLTSFYLKALIIFFLLSHVVDTPQKLKFTAAALSMIAIPLALSGVTGFLSGGFASQELSRGLDRIAGYNGSLTSNPNDLALMLDLILPLSVALFLDSRRTAWRLLLLASMGLSLVGVVATYSRGGFVTLGVIALVYLWLLLRHGRTSLVFAACILLLITVPMLPGGYAHRLATITDIQSDPTGSAQQRWAEMRDATEYVLNHPLIGVGVGQNALALNQVDGGTWEEVHNVYLQYAMELGIPGLVLFLLLMRECLRGAKRAKRARDAPSSLKLLAEGLWISLIAFAVSGFFYPDGYQFYFYYMAALAIAAQSIAARSTSTRAAA